MKYYIITLLLIISSISSLHAQERGKATYYSRGASGSRCSDGSRLDNNAYTCAHKTHPFGTMLLVKNLNNGKTVVVKVTDRGPFGKGRIIDLTYKAASDIGMIAAGVVPVEVSVYVPEAQAIKDVADSVRQMFGLPSGDTHPSKNDREKHYHTLPDAGTKK